MQVASPVGSREIPRLLQFCHMPIVYQLGPPSSLVVNCSCRLHGSRLSKLANAPAGKLTNLLFCCQPSWDVRQWTSALSTMQTTQAVLLQFAVGGVAVTTMNVALFSCHCLRLGQAVACALL